MQRRSRFLTAIIVFELSLAAMAVLVGPWFSVDVADELTQPFRQSLNVGALAAAAKFTIQVAMATMPFVLGLALIMRTPLPALVRLRQLVAERFVPILLPLPTWGLGLIALAAGVGEEVLFRGLVQSALSNYFPLTPWLAIGPVAVLFGLLHLITPTYGLLATIAGAYLGWLFFWTGNLYIPIGVHGAYDLIALLWLVRGHKETALRVEQGRF